MLDFLHGNSVIFGNVRKKLESQNSDLCFFCQVSKDSPSHQLFFCSQLEDESREELLDSIEDTYDFQQEVMFPSGKKVQAAFIRRVKFIRSCYEELPDAVEED